MGPAADITPLGFEAAFPPALADDVAAVVRVMPVASLMPHGAFTVVVASREVTIPYRIYNSEPHPATGHQPMRAWWRPRGAHLSPRQNTILACIYTRHTNGWVRERRLNEIIASDDDWVVPFVLHLLGEYVIEIARVIDNTLSTLQPGDTRHDSYQRFVLANPRFMELLTARATSYWACYYRSDIPDRTDYPGLAAVERLRSLGDWSRRSTQ